MSSVSTRAWLAVLSIASLGAGACNVLPHKFPSGSGGSGPSKGGSSGSAGTGGTAIFDAGTPFDGGSSAVDGGPAPRCAAVAPAGSLIADFNAFNNQAFGLFGIDPVVGGTYLTPGSLLEDFSEGAWHLAGTVTGPVSFGLSWSCPGVIDGACVLDLSRYAGIRFTVNGDIGSSGFLEVTIGDLRDEAPTVAFGCGTCNMPSGTEGCVDPFTLINLGETVSPPQAFSLVWNYVLSGDPYPSIDSGRVTGIAWTLPAATNGSYPVDFTLDDIRLIPIPR